MNLVIFIIIYLIVCLLLSILISFLFLRQYACKDKSKVEELKYKYCFSYYFNTAFFSLSIFHIFISALDHSLSYFENYPSFQNNFIEKIFTILPSYYLIIQLISYVISGLSRLYYYVNTSVYFFKCDIACDAISRCTYCEKQSGRIFCNNYIWIIPLTLLIIFILTVDFLTIRSTFDIIKLVINAKNFLDYFKLLFYIGFIVTNFYELNVIESDKMQKQNYEIWKLGKIYLYYNEERKDLKNDIDKIKNKYEESFSGFDYKSLENEDQKFICLFQNKYNQFIQDIQKLDKDYEIIDIKFENIEEAKIKFRQKIYEDFLKENDTKDVKEKLYQIME